MKKVVFKFLHYTDTHHTKINPDNRLDDCYSAVIDKVEEIRDVVIEEGIDEVFHTGDFYNSPNISDSVASEIGKVYKTFPKPIKVIGGNHDLIGNNLATINQSKLGLFGELGTVELIGRNDKIIIEKEGISVQITAAPSDFGIDNDKDALILDEKDADIAIHLTHAMLLREGKNFGSYVPIKEVAEKTLADITLCGHWHLGFDIYESNGKFFLNPGALVRKYNFVEEIERTPQYSIITIYDDKSISCEYRELKCAMPGEAVLDRSKIEEKQFYTDQLNNFKESIINNETTSYNVNVTDIISMLSEQKNIDPKVTKLAIEKVENAKISLNIQE